MMDRPVVLLGAGGHTRVVAETLHLLGASILGHVAPQPNSHSTADLGPYLGDDDVLPGLVPQADIAIGLGFVDAAGALRRAALLDRLHGLQARLKSVVHPQALVSPSARLEDGVFVAMGALVGAHAQIGQGAIVNTGAIADHDSVLGANTHLATGARLAGGVHVGRDVLIGTGSTVRQGQKIANRAIIAAGATVVKDVSSDTTIMGPPARPR